MKYMLLIYASEAEWDSLSEDEMRAIYREYFTISSLPGVTNGNQLHPAETATTVRVEDAKTLTIDRPFADKEETISGYYLLDADERDAALEIAARIPAARLGGAVEVRPVVET